MKLLRTTFVAMGLRVGAACFNLAMILVLARASSVSTFGYCSAILASSAIVMTFCIRGYDSAAVRFGSTLAGPGWAKFDALARQTNVVMSLVAGGAFAVFGGVMHALGGNSVAVVAWGIAAISPMLARIRYYESVLRAHGSTVESQVYSGIVAPLLTIVGILGVGSLGVEVLWGFAVVRALAMLGLVVILMLRARGCHGRTGDAGLEFDRSNVRSASYFLMWVAVLNAVISQADIPLVVALAGATEGGAYAAAARVASALAIVVVAVNFGIAPQMARLHADGRMGELSRLYRRGVILCAVLMTLCGGGVVAFAPQILGLLGGDYVGSVEVLRVLVLGQCVNSAFGPIGSLLNMTGAHADALMAIGVGAALNLGLVVALVPNAGGLGAAIASVLAIACWNVLMFARALSRGLISVRGILSRG